MPAPYLTSLFSDSFGRANVNPLAAPWLADTYGDPELAIVSDLCTGALHGDQWCVQSYGEALPNDQFAQATTTLPDGFALGIRKTDDGTQYFSNLSWKGYTLSVSGNAWYLYQSSSNSLLAHAFFAGGRHSGDVFTIAAIGSTIYALWNGTQLASVTDATTASGGTVLSIYDSATNQGFSNWSVGSASATPPAGDPPDDPTLIYLGQVVVVGSAPAGLASPYLGHYRVITNPRVGAANPYLRKIVVLAQAPAGESDPMLGEIVVISSVPAGQADIFLGNATEI